MELLPGNAMINFIFPNNAYIFWGLTIVTYPYITGLMAGAFVVSALSHVFKVEIFKPIGNFALIAALPVVFITSAIVSGMAMLLLMYTFTKWRRTEVNDYKLIKVFMAYLWGAFILTFALEMLEVAAVVYERGWHWSQVGPLLSGPLFDSYVIGQVLILSVGPVILTGYVVLSSVKGKALLYLANLCCLLLLTQVLFMRFNVVIGAQLISKSERGFVPYEWELLGSEGILASAFVFSLPFFAFYFLSRFLPILGNSVR